MNEKSQKQSPPTTTTKRHQTNRHILKTHRKIDKLLGVVQMWHECDRKCGTIIGETANNIKIKFNIRWMYARSAQKFVCSPSPKVIKNHFVNASEAYVCLAGRIIVQHKSIKNRLSHGKHEKKKEKKRSNEKTTKVNIVKYMACFGVAAFFGSVYTVQSTSLLCVNLLVSHSGYL